MSFEPNLYDYGLQVSRGLIDGVAPLNRFGFNPEVDSATVPEDIWTAGGLWVPPTAARIHDVVSSNAADTAAGTGARTVTLTGLTTWDDAETSEVITMNGLTPVSTVNSYVMVNSMTALTAGSGGTNAGDITATAQVDGTVTCVITADVGTSLMAIYGLPSTQSLYVVHYFSWLTESGGATNEVRMQGQVKSFADQPDSLFVDVVELGLFGGGTSFVAVPISPPPRITGPALLKVRCVAAGSNNAGIGAGFSGYLIDNVAC